MYENLETTEEKFNFMGIVKHSEINQETMEHLRRKYNIDINSNADNFTVLIESYSHIDNSKKIEYDVVLQTKNNTEIIQSIPLKTGSILEKIESYYNSLVA